MRYAAGLRRRRRPRAPASAGPTRPPWGSRPSGSQRAPRASATRPPRSCVSRDSRAVERKRQPTYAAHAEPRQPSALSARVSRHLWNPVSTIGWRSGIQARSVARSRAFLKKVGLSHRNMPSARASVTQPAASRRRRGATWPSSPAPRLPCARHCGHPAATQRTATRHTPA